MHYFKILLGGIVKFPDLHQWYLVHLEQTWLEKGEIWRGEQIPPLAILWIIITEVVISQLHHVCINYFVKYSLYVSTNDLCVIGNNKVEEIK